MSASRKDARPNRVLEAALVVMSIVLSLGIAEVTLSYVPPDLGLLHTLMAATDDTRPYVLRAGARIDFEGLYTALPRPVAWQVNVSYCTVSWPAPGFLPVTTICGETSPGLGLTLSARALEKFGERIV